jgi:hypothetical protein
VAKKSQMSALVVHLYNFLSSLNIVILTKSIPMLVQGLLKVVVSMRISRDLELDSHRLTL